MKLETPTHPSDEPSKLRGFHSPHSLLTPATSSPPPTFLFFSPPKFLPQKFPLSSPNKARRWSPNIAVAAHCSPSPSPNPLTVRRRRCSRRRRRRSESAMLNCNNYSFWNQINCEKSVLNVFGMMLSFFEMDSRSGRGKNKRFWKKEEEETMLNCLMEISLDPRWKGEGGFKGGFTGQIERMMKERFLQDSSKS